MQLFARRIPVKELPIHFLIVFSVLFGYGYLIYAGFMLPLITHRQSIDIAFAHFVSPDPIFPGAPNSPWCYSALPIKGFLSKDERGDHCQLNFKSFTLLCNLFGVQMSDGERKLLFDTLDITENGYLSWGEISIDYFNTNDSALIYYIKRWRLSRKFGYGAGLTRIEGFDYEPFRSLYFEPIGS